MIIKTFFDSQTLSDAHQEAVQQASDRIARLGDEELADQELALRDVWTPVATVVPRLRRGEATFDSSERSEPTVTVTVPYDGNYNYLYCEPVGGRETAGLPYGANDSTFVDGRRTSTVRLQEQFAAGVGVDQVRAWAKGQVDLVETYLDRLRAEAEELDDAALARLRSALQARAAALTSNKSLKEQLGTGI